MNLNDMLTIALAIVTIVGVASPYIAGLPWVKKRPGLANFISGAGYFAARVKHLIPAGSTFAQAEAIVVANMGPFLTEYADSAKAAKLTQAQAQNIAISATLDALPAGHITTLPPAPAVDDIVPQVLDKLKAQPSTIGVDRPGMSVTASATTPS